MKYTCEVKSWDGENSSVACGRKAVTKILDIVCLPPRKSFRVCEKHKKMFLTGNHYKEVRKKIWRKRRFPLKRGK